METHKEMEETRIVRDGRNNLFRDHLFNSLLTPKLFLCNTFLPIHLSVLDSLT